MLTQHFVMLQRNLIYTGMTRAKKLLILIGSEKAVQIAVNNTRKRPRFSNLAARLKEEQNKLL
jgi:exodeoxyribonuclease V alpha subunit